MEGDEEYFRRPVEEKMSKGALLKIQPLFVTPFTYMSYILTHPKPQRSYDVLGYKMMIKFYECNEAYGQYKGFRLCRAIFEDYMEALSHEKRMQRAWVLMTERRKIYFRSFFTGEEVPTENLFGEAFLNQ